MTHPLLRRLWWALTVPPPRHCPLCGPVPHRDATHHDLHCPTRKDAR